MMAGTCEASELIRGSIGSVLSLEKVLVNNFVKEMSQYQVLQLKKQRHGENKAAS